jgi:hypothetical protein
MNIADRVELFRRVAEEVFRSHLIGQEIVEVIAAAAAATCGGGSSPSPGGSSVKLEADGSVTILAPSVSIGATPQQDEWKARAEKAEAYLEAITTALTNTGVPITPGTQVGRIWELAGQRDDARREAATEHQRAEWLNARMMEALRVVDATGLTAGALLDRVKLLKEQRDEALEDLRKIQEGGSHA